MNLSIYNFIYKFSSKIHILRNLIFICIIFNIKLNSLGTFC